MPGQMYGKLLTEWSQAMYKSYCSMKPITEDYRGGGWVRLQCEPCVTRLRWDSARYSESKMTHRRHGYLPCLNNLWETPYQQLLTLVPCSYNLAVNEVTPPIRTHPCEALLYKLLAVVKMII